MTSLRTETKEYFERLGKYVSSLRKKHKFTQCEVARGIGVSQQCQFAFETGQRRMSVVAIDRTAKFFGVPLEELIRMSVPLSARKGRLSPRAIRHAERLQSLTKSQQRLVVRIIDTLEASNTRSKDR